MALKKAAKKMAKKAAKKGAKQEHGARHEGKDVRRAYEHMGRLEALRGGLPRAVTGQLTTLTALAQASLGDGDAKSAADLLRAGEHLSFAALASGAKQVGLSDELEAAIMAEYEHLRTRAEDHWSPGAPELSAIYAAACAAAEGALAKGAYRKALESMRAAEALSHVQPESRKLDAGSGAKKRLKGPARLDQGR